MRYVRLLKPPHFTPLTGHITLLITITSDLGDTFLSTPLPLSVSLRSATYPGSDDVFVRRTALWTPGSRVLPLTLDVSGCDVDWPARVYVAAKAGAYAAAAGDTGGILSGGGGFSRGGVGLGGLVGVGVGGEGGGGGGAAISGGVGLNDLFRHHGGSVPGIVPAWSDILNPEREVCMAEKTVERRFGMLNRRVLSVWEEAGEEIAGHIWDAGLALTTHLDLLVNLQIPDPHPHGLLDHTLSTATYKKLHILELGCGTGLVGLSLAQLIPDTSVLLTDLPSAAPLVSRNIASLSPAMGSSADFQPLEWDAAARGALPPAVGARAWDLVLVADCTYNPDSVPALVGTLGRVVERSVRTVVVVATKVRHESERVFFERMEQAGFVVASKARVGLPRDPGAEEEGEGEEVEIYVYYHRLRPAGEEEGEGQGVKVWPD